MSEPISLFIVEDQAPVLKGLLKLLSTLDDVQVVGTALSGEAALEQLPASGARVALLDIELPGIDGLDLVSALRARRVECELLMLTSFFDEEKVFQAMRRGAAGYLLKGADARKLQQAIVDVDRGGTVIEPRLARTFWRFFKGVEAPPRPPDDLTEDEIELLQLMAKGLSNAEAGSALGVPRRNVRTRLEKVYAKLGVRSHVEAVVEGLRRGVVQL